MSWHRLFKKFPFFKAYQHFIEYEVLSKTEDCHKAWSGFGESKIKALVRNIENKCNDKIGRIIELRPYPKPTTLKNEEYPFNSVFYIGIRIARNVEVRHDLVDFNNSRKSFYEFIAKELDKNQSYNTFIEERLCDLRIDYKTRA